MKRFATSHVVGDYSREASGIRWLPAGGPAGRAWRGLFVSDDGDNLQIRKKFADSKKKVLKPHPKPF